jgi:hypothetical protein
MPRGAVTALHGGMAKLKRAGIDVPEFIGRAVAGGHAQLELEQLEEPVRSIATATAKAAELLATVYGPKWVIEQADAA